MEGTICHDGFGMVKVEIDLVLNMRVIELTRRNDDRKTCAVRRKQAEKSYGGNLRFM